MCNDVDLMCAGTPYTQHAYGWSVTTNGFLFAGIGGGCIVSLVFLQLGTVYFQDRTLLLITELLMAAGFAMLINYPFDDYVREMLDLPSFQKAHPTITRSSFQGSLSL